MLQQSRRMPPGVLWFLVYAFLMLAFLGLTLSKVIELAIEAPVSPLGLVYMLLLAYLIFTITLVLQRKQAAHTLAVVLAVIGLPLFLFHIFGWIVMLVAVSVIVALLRPTSRAWFTEI